MTNRALYLAVAELGEENRDSARSLEEYLRVLWARACPLAQRDALTPEEFLRLLADAFTFDAPPFQEAWRVDYDRYEAAADTDGYTGWEAVLLRQIVDLREMAEQGQMEDEYRSFGINSPRGAYWFNFTPRSYLECATTGEYGGWEPEDNTGRVFVPGPVAVMGEDGQLETRNPENVARPVFEILHVTWTDFQEFLLSGQLYE